METKYIISDTLQSLIDWGNIMQMERYAGGHDDQMKGLFKDSTVIAHWNEGGYQGMVATCVRLSDKRYVIYNDYYGSCSGCDSWENASDKEVKSMCINLSNGAYIFLSLLDVKQYLESIIDNPNESFDWSKCAKPLLERINVYDFRCSLARMGFDHVIGNNESMTMLHNGFLIEIEISNEAPQFTVISISEFDDKHHFLKHNISVETPQMPIRVVDFDIVMFIMANIRMLLSNVLNIVGKNIENELTSNCREAIAKALNK